MKRGDPNIAMLQLVANGFGPLVEEVVFLGGCATGLMIDDKAAPDIRASDDVDVIIEAATQHDYHDFSAQLRKKGFIEDRSDNAPMCRWLYRGIKVDVMPTDSAILGFTNRWYADAMTTAERMRLPNGTAIRMVTAPFFLATKLEAFYGRGKGDFIASHDLEDMLAVMDGRSSIVQEVSECTELRDYLGKEFTKLLEDDAFQDALPGHLPGDAASQQRLPIILERMTKIAAKQSGI